MHKLEHFKPGSLSTAPYRARNGMNLVKTLKRKSCFGTSVVYGTGKARGITSHIIQPKNENEMSRSLHSALTKNTANTTLKQREL